MLPLARLSWGENHQNPRRSIAWAPVLSFALSLSLTPMALAAPTSSRLTSATLQSVSEAAAAPGQPAEAKPVAPVENAVEAALTKQSEAQEVISTTARVSAMFSALRGYFTDDDIDALYEYLRDSLVASLLDREEPELPPELMFRLKILEQRFKKEGMQYMEGVVQQIEADLTKLISDDPAPPTSTDNTGKAP